jgi:tRNA-dihydrouridine synthase
MIDPVLIMAPMRGITNRHYRAAFYLHFGGLDAAMAPFIPTVNASRIHPRLLRDILPETAGSPRLIPQLIGNNAEDFVQMAAALRDLGHDEVNWNLGCPHKPIRRKLRGAGLLPHPEKVDAFLEHVCKKSACAVSVKVRLGVSEKTELLNLIPVLNRHPLSEVIIHPRTAEQMYAGEADIDAFEEAYRSLTQPVCYNGDIIDVGFFKAIRRRFPDVTRFMLGRGLLANPFLCEEIKQEPPHLRRCGGYIERLAAFHDDLLSRYEDALHGDHPVLGKMKEFWTYQSIHLSNGRQMFKKLKKTQRLSTYRALVAEHLAKAVWRAAPGP